MAKTGESAEIVVTRQVVENADFAEFVETPDLTNCGEIAKNAEIVRRKS